MPRRRLAFTANAGQPRATINAAWRRLLPVPGGAAVMTDRAVTLVSVASPGICPGRSLPPVLVAGVRIEHPVAHLWPGVRSRLSPACRPVYPHAEMSE